MLFFRLFRRWKGKDVLPTTFRLMVSIVLVVSSDKVFTHKSLKSMGDKSKAEMKDNSNCSILLNRF